MNKIPVWHNPIIAEINAARERLTNQFQNDLAAYSKSAEAHCRALCFQVAESQHFRHDAADAVAPAAQPNFALCVKACAGVGARCLSC